MQWRKIRQKRGDAWRSHTKKTLTKIMKWGSGPRKYLDKSFPKRGNSSIKALSPEHPAWERKSKEARVAGAEQTREGLAGDKRDWGAGTFCRPWGPFLTDWLLPWGKKETVGWIEHMCDIVWLTVWRTCLADPLGLDCRRKQVNTPPYSEQIER